MKPFNYFSSSGKTGNPATTSTLFTRPQENISKGSTAMQCVFYGKLHFSASCEKVKDIEERKKTLLRDRRCFLCIKVGQCRKCGAAYHQSICPKEQVTRNSNNLNQSFPSSATCQNCITSVEKKTTPTTGSQTTGNVNTAEQGNLGEQSSTGEQVFTVSGTVKSKKRSFTENGQCNSSR